MLDSTFNFNMMTLILQKNLIYFFDLNQKTSIYCHLLCRVKMDVITLSY